MSDSKTQEGAPKDYPDILDRARVNLFPHTDELCELIKSDF